MAAFALSVIVNEYPIGQVSFSCFDYFAYEPESQIIIVCVRQICFFLIVHLCCVNKSFRLILCSV